MKRIVVLMVSLAALAALLSCSTISEGLVLRAAAGSAPAEVADFKADEVLVANGDAMMDPPYRLARVLKAASEATKNQAQVVYVRDGSKEWARYVVPSHKANKKELEVGAVVFYPGGWAEYEQMSAEDYRKTDWRLGRVTSTDDLFKGLVEVSGENYYTQWLRIPEGQIEE